MTIRIYKSNDGKPPYKIIGGNVSYTYDNDSKMFSAYSGDTWLCTISKAITVIITYQPDEVLVYEKWDKNKDQYGNKIGEIQKFLNEEI